MKISSELRHVVKAANDAGIPRNERRAVYDVLQDTETDPMIRQTLNPQRIASLFRLLNQNSRPPRHKKDTSSSDMLALGNLLHDMGRFFQNERITELSPAERTLLNAGIHAIEQGFFRGTLFQLSREDAALLGLVINKLAKIQERFDSGVLDGFDQHRLAELISHVRTFAQEYYSDHRAEEEMIQSELECEAIALDLRKDPRYRDYFEKLDIAKMEHASLRHDLETFLKPENFQAYLHDVIKRMRLLGEALILYADLPDLRPLLDRLTHDLEHSSQAIATEILQKFFLWRESPYSFNPQSSGLRGYSVGEIPTIWHTLLNLAIQHGATREEYGEIYSPLCQASSDYFSSLQKKRAELLALPLGKVVGMGKHTVALRKALEPITPEFSAVFDELMSWKSGPMFAFQERFFFVRDAFSSVHLAEEALSYHVPEKPLLAFHQLEKQEENIRKSSSKRTKLLTAFEQSSHAIEQSLVEPSGGLYLAKSGLIVSEMLRARFVQGYLEDLRRYAVHPKTGVGTFSFQNPEDLGTMYTGYGMESTRQGNFQELHFIPSHIPFAELMVHYFEENRSHP